MVHWVMETETLSVAVIPRLKVGQTLVTPPSTLGDVTVKVGKVLSMVLPQAEALVERFATHVLNSVETGMGAEVSRYCLATRRRVNQS
jgi:hypothetical protein